MSFQKYHQAVKFLSSLQNLPIQNHVGGRVSDPTIYGKRLRYLLDRIGNPEKKLRYIHISGTGGKGTVVAMIHNALVKSGRRAGSFTSPHTTTNIERFRIDSKLMAPGAFANLVQRLKPIIEDSVLNSPYGRPSCFEIETAMALLAFVRAKCQWAVIEVGCGGRYDATNIIPNHDLALITNIGLDHTHILGKTLSSIARDKVGIVKKGCVFFTTEKRPHLLRFFLNHCRKVKAKMVELDSDDLNATLAAAALKHIGVSQRDIDFGIRATKLPCRFEVTQDKPKIILDGAHNPSKVLHLTKRLKLEGIDGAHCVFGCAADKDAQKMIKLLDPFVSKWYFTHFSTIERKAYGLKELKEYTNKKSKLFLTPLDALGAAKTAAGKNGTILVAGSFFLTGELRREWISEEEILRKRSSFPKYRTCLTNTQLS